MSRTKELIAAALLQVTALASSSQAGDSFTASACSSAIVTSEVVRWLGAARFPEIPLKPPGCCYQLTPGTCSGYSSNPHIACAVYHLPTWTRSSTRVVFTPRWHPQRWVVWLPEEIPVTHGVDCEAVLK